MKRRACAILLGAGVAGAAQAQQLPANVRCVRNGAPAGGDGRSWAAAWPELQEALLTASASGGQITEVWVAQGTYAVPLGNAGPGFPVSNVSLYGGFAGTETSASQRPAGTRTLLSSHGASNAVLNIDTVSPVTVDGFELANLYARAIHIMGPATLVNLVVSSGSFGGLEKTDQSPITVRSCHFHGNPFEGRDVMINGPGAIVDSVFESWPSISGGVDLTNLTVTRCTFDCRGEIGGLSGDGVTFQDCDIRCTCTHGGLFGTDMNLESCRVTLSVDSGTSLWMTRGSIRRSEVQAGVSIEPLPCMRLTGTTMNDSVIRATGYQWAQISGACTVLNCRILGASGPIVGEPGAAPRFINCLFQHGGLPSMFQVGSQWRFDNCIIWGTGTDDATTFAAPAGMTGFVNYCDVRGWSGALGGLGNISAHPFLYADGTLTPASPCIDAGDNSRVPPGAVYDFVRGCRIVDGDVNGSRVVDMGPHEFTLCAANCDCSTGAPVLNVLDFNCFLHRFSVGDPWANCDRSTEAPVLNVLDFNCFVQRFTAGCP
jgi:hypothetical protein